MDAVDEADDPALQLLARGYFHQDYLDTSKDEVAAVKQFVEWEGPEDVARLRREIQELLERAATEDELKAIWRGEYHAQYDPPRYGLTYRQWFERILEILDA